MSNFFITNCHSFIYNNVYKWGGSAQLVKKAIKSMNINRLSQIIRIFAIQSFLKG